MVQVGSPSRIPLRSNFADESAITLVAGVVHVVGPSPSATAASSRTGSSRKYADSTCASQHQLLERRGPLSGVLTNALHVLLKAAGKALAYAEEGADCDEHRMDLQEAQPMSN
jgi:hypothetical protein